MAIYPRAAGDRRVSAAALQTVVAAIFERCGMRAADARLLGETLVHSDRRGVHSHGVLRVPDYVGKLTREGVDPRGAPRVVSERGGAIRVDGANTMGQIGGTFAMDRAMERARTAGIAFAALGNSNHCGALDWYTLRASRAGLVGLAGTNALPTMAPLGGTDKIVGINPLSIALPAGRHPDFVLDFAFGATAHGKIRVYHQKGTPIPEGWAFDTDGHPTTDAAAAMAGLIQPIGGHKGVALGMAIGMLASFLADTGYGTETGNMVDGPTPGSDGQFFAAIDIDAFVPLDTFRRRVDAAIDEVHGSRRRAGVDRLLVPGEVENDIAADYDAAGILLAADTINDVVGAAETLGVDAAPLVAPAAH
ncbi:Ldh family oxidoreductase [Acuticoccus mangrovi]|uniref:Ldh family oxidoreductase n=1 Tax=Acuticoccus mangrovi TaxID=2796142 RepID=A0A934ING0_9HYPH|nr:Ldh family oxidoreductase [Acuticoccus mangrovi]MBJ3775805.1 Ldh family oxidoreductase [Acuticoccus mangrovi]